LFKIFVTVDKHQRFKSFISQITSIRLEHPYSNAEKSFVSNFEIADSFIKLWVMMFSAVQWPLDRLQAQHNIV